MTTLRVAYRAMVQPLTDGGDCNAEGDADCLYIDLGGRVSRCARRLIVISDLHIGGEAGDAPRGTRGFTMFHQSEQLASFIRHIVCERGVDTELVINGDFVDFLAERWEGDSPWVPFISDEKKATDRFSLIAGRNRVVFDALREFLAAGNCVTVLLGNHDVELSLPAVRRHLAELVEGDTRNLRFVYDGEAYVVGEVIIEHGNRYDQWNVVDHDSLRRTRSAASRRESLAPEIAFQPPPGSHMVSGVLNHVKERYPFVDLLKPEKEAMLLLLMALSPEYRRHLARIAKHYWASRSHRHGDSGQPRFEGDISSAYGPIAKVLASSCSHPEIERFLKLTFGTDSSFERDDEGEIGAYSLSKISTLSPLLFANADSTLHDRLPALLIALRALRNERETDLSIESDLYLTPASNLAERGFKAVIFGHTHLPKKVVRETFVYLNTGTWADVIEFPYSNLDGPDEAVSKWLTGFAISLENSEYSEYIKRRQHYARIDVDADGKLISADLLEASHGAAA